MPRNGSGVYSLPPGSTFTPNTLAQSSVVNGINADLATDLNTPRPIVAGGTGASTVAGAQAALGLSTGTFGLLFGLTLSNNVGDATNSIDITTGTAAEQGVASPNLMTLSSIISKSVAVAWTVGGTTGSPAGGLDTGAVANGTYHVWLIQRSDTSVVDALFSLSATAPTMPANYDRKRRIGSILRVGGTILGFVQIGDIFRLKTVVNDASVTNPGTAAVTRAITVPTGIIVEAIVMFGVFSTSTGPLESAASSMLVNAQAPANSTPELYVFTKIGAANTVSGRILTNTSAQIRTQATASAADIIHQIGTTGWVDQRGRTS